MIGNMAPGMISIEFGARGPNASTATACAAGSHAIGDATCLIRRGAADAMITGGVEAVVTECCIAETFQAAGLGGAIGHAAVCNMDYTWPVAFNPDFKMERTKTLMQGHDCCNHRYIDTT